MFFQHFLLSYRRKLFLRLLIEEAMSRLEATDENFSRYTYRVGRFILGGGGGHHYIIVK